MTPRLVVAAPASRSGKTTVALGLMAAFAARGLAVSPHKVGPDYIDAGSYALATGRPGRNLDPYLTAESMVAPLFEHGARGADLAVVEGVMGLYDGVAGTAGFASTAHVAELLDAPVLLVVDASSAGRSVAATVHGFRTYGQVRIGGVVLNKIGSDRHAEICREAVEELSVPVLGVVRRDEEIATPARHLGLIPAAERRVEPRATVERLGDLIARSCDLDAIHALARSAPPLTAAPWTPPEEDIAEQAPGTGQPVVAVAGGEAFTFGYAENGELLKAAGATVVRFDPLRDERLPDGTRGLVIGGGFSEVFAADLSANTRLRAEIARFDGPVYAECAGLLYLVRKLDGLPMCGLFDATATMTARLTRGYRAAVALADSVVAKAGQRVHGYEFHRTAIMAGKADETDKADKADGWNEANRPSGPDGPSRQPAWQWATPPAGSHQDGFVQNGHMASSLLLHWAGTPGLAARFVKHCRQAAPEGRAR